MSGFKFLLNNRELAAVSIHKRNIITAYVAGDVVGPELATGHLIGGYYGEPEETTHRIWLDGVVLAEGDEIEIQFLKSIVTSGAGMSIEEHAASHANDDVIDEVGDEDMYSWLARQPKVREHFWFELEMPGCELIKTTTAPEDFSFHFGVMWKWAKPDEAGVQLSSTSLDNMKQKNAGKTLSRFKLHPGQGVKFRVGTG